MLAVAKSGHLDSSLSAADIVAALYYRVLRHDPQRAAAGRAATASCSRKGHAAPIQYAALARHGYFPMEDLMGLRKLDAHLQGHPDMTRTPGVEVSTGSLGPGPFDVARDRARRCGSTGSTTRTCSRSCPTATARRARPGRPRWRPRTSGSRT